MQVHKKQMRLSAVLVTLALGAAACGGGSNSDSDDSSAKGPSGGTFSYTLSNPENPLVPGNTSESEGAQIIDALFTGLVTYDVETSKVEMEGVAESIESDDSTLWTVKLKEGWKFHDGTPVDAQSFVNAWNYTALSTNAQGGSYFMENIEGYDDLQAELDPNNKDVVLTPPKAEKLSGLKIVDPQTFTVQLSAPFAQYPVTVGYNAFYPLPKAFFTDPKAFGTKPIGNGPFQAEEEFRQDVGFTLTRFEDFAGDKAKADAVEIKVIPDLNTAYTEVQAGGLDILDTVPPEVITTAPDEFGERFLSRSSSTFTYMGFPTYDPRFDDKKVRQAFSMAIDRKAITKAIFNDTREPAFSAISPVVDGSRKDACKYCTYDPEAAKNLLAETDFDTSKPIDLWFNSGAGHEAWVTAVGNQLRENLGVTYGLKGDLPLSQYLKEVGRAKKFTGPFRLGWGMDYPSPQNYLEPLYTEAALPPGSNTAFYVNPAFDAKVEEGNKAKSNDEAIELYQEAEDILLEDMPIMPMFFGKLQAVHSENVSNVAFNAFGRADLASVTVNK